MFYYTSRRRKNKKIAVIVICAVLLVALIVLAVVFWDDLFGGEPSAQQNPTQSPSISTPTPVPEPQKPVDETGLSVSTRFGVPEGYERVAVRKGSFGEYLRQYPLLPYGTVPKLFDGTDHLTAPTVGVLDQAVISKNQSEADAIMMLYAQYLYEQQLYDQISFDFYMTPKFACDYQTWLTGQRLQPVGNKVEWYLPEGNSEQTPNRQNFREYLRSVMMYANTASLKAQLSPTTTASLAVGDVLIDHGHAMLVMDVCRNETTGELRFICATGIASAGETYLLADEATQSVWLTLEADGTFIKDGDVYAADCVRRF